MNEEHDRSAEARVRRFLGGEWEAAGPYGNQPLEPRIDGDWKVFELECSAFEWRIDAELPPVNALGYNGMWPGPILRVTEGDKVRAIVKNSMAESTTVHFHGQSLVNKMDGVPLSPSRRSSRARRSSTSSSRRRTGRTCTTRTTTRRTRSGAVCWARSWSIRRT